MSRKNIIEIIKLIQAGLTQDDYGKSKKRFDDLIKELEKPITLADFLGWEDDVEYKCYDDKFIIMDNQLYIWNYAKRDWIDAYSVSINRFEQLRQAKKVQKEKVYYAKIKGWELMDCSDIYWNRYDRYHSLIVSDTREAKGFTTKLTKPEWNKIGINDTNADFAEAE